VTVTITTGTKVCGEVSFARGIHCDVAGAAVRAGTAPIHRQCAMARAGPAEGYSTSIRPGDRRLEETNRKHRAVLRRGRDGTFNWIATGQGASS